MSFDSCLSKLYSAILRLNPFRAGRCLSTEHQSSIKRSQFVSIPFEQGNVFRLLLCLALTMQFVRLNPFRAGRCLSTLLEIYYVYQI